MGHHRPRCGLLVRHEDQAQGPARRSIYSVQRVLPDLRGAGGREGQEGQGHADGGPSACGMEQGDDAVSVCLDKSHAAEVDVVSAA